MGDGQRPTEGDSRLRGTREPLQQATDLLEVSQVALTSEWMNELRRSHALIDDANDITA